MAHPEQHLLPLLNNTHPTGEAPTVNCFQCSQNNPNNGEFSKTRQHPQPRTWEVRAGQRQHSDFNVEQTSCKMNLSAPSWNWRVFLHISICCPASSSGQAAYNSKSTIVIPSCFRNVQFEIRAGGGRMGLEETGTQIQIIQTANLILNPCLMVPVTGPPNICFSTGFQVQTHSLCPTDILCH